MKKILLLAFVLVAGSLVIAQQPAGSSGEQLDGVWKLVITNKSDKRQVGEAHMAVQRSGDQLVMRDLSTKTSIVTVATSATHVPVRIEGYDPASSPDTVGQIVVPAHRTLKTETMSELVKEWEFQIPGATPRKTDWTVLAIRLTSVWACSHSNPTHTATSTNEMQEMTTKHMCTGWRQVTRP